MNQQFFELPLEKQQRILNAGLEVFSQNDYKRASTDQIAVKADISKGLLFYYFHNKKTLYLYLYQYAEERLKQSVLDEHFHEITDFFELCEYSMQRKCQLLSENPYIIEFIRRAFYSEKEEVSEDMDRKMKDASVSIFGEYFKRINMSKFKKDINPLDVLQMLTWTAEGYLHEQRRAGVNVDLGAIIDKYKIWSNLLKQSAYKEEYLV